MNDFPRFIAGLSSLLLFLGGAPLFAVESAWKPGGPSTDWYESQNWTNGVPQHSGDLALFNNAATLTTRAQLNAPASLSQLAFTGVGSFELTGSGPLTFVDPAANAQPIISVQGAGSNSQLTALLNLPIVVPADETLSVALSNRARIQLHGSISGEGGISFSGRPNGLLSEIRGNNSYSGLTTIDLGSHQIDVVSSTAFGDATSETILRSGRLNLWEGTAEEFVVERNGVLLPTPSNASYTGKITLAGGVLLPSERFSSEDGLAVVIDSELSIRGRGYVGLSPFVGAIAELKGPITGDGLLVFQGSIHDTISTLGTIQLRGDVLASDRSNVVVAGGFEPAGDLRVDGESFARVRLAGDASKFGGDVEIGSGVMTVATDFHANSVKVDARRPTRSEGWKEGAVTIETGAALDAAALEFYAGDIAGRITGIQQITKQTRGAGALSRLEGFAGVIAVEGGYLDVLDPAGLGATTGHTSVLSRQGAVIALYQEARVEDAIYLNNASGFDYQGSLLGWGEMAGTLQLGDQGAYIGGNGGGGSARDGNLRVSGSIRGGALYKNGAFNDLLVTGDGHTYAGDTHVLAGQLILSQNGRLESTPVIRVGGGRINTSGQPTAALVLDNRGASGQYDRIADQIPVNLHGGRLFVQGSSGQSKETIGKVTLEGGWNRIDSTGGVLRINQLERKSGSIAAFLPTALGRVEIPSATLDDGILGGWAVFHQNDYRPQGFATVVGGAVAHASSVVQSLKISTSAQNVDVQSSDTLTSDVTVNSFKTSGTANIDLAGNRLTVDSGGVLTLGYTTISNGTLTAGPGGPSELFLHNYWTLDVDADIVDNGGPLGLHVSGISFVNLSGTNSYTGGTRITRTSGIHVLNRSAVPAGDVVDIDSGRYMVDFSDGQPLSLERLILRGSSLVEGTSQTSIDANVYELYSGIIDQPISGDGHLIKRGEGEVELIEDSSDYVGTILVEQGILRLSRPIGGSGPAESMAITVREGGVLSANTLPDSRLLVLEGGELRANIPSGSAAFPIEVRGSGAITGRWSLSSAIRGEGQLTLDGPFGNVLSFIGSFNELDGDVTLTGGAVHINGDNHSFPGVVHVRAAGAYANSSNAFGPRGGIVHPEGILTVSSDLQAPVTLAGGLLRVSSVNTNVDSLNVTTDSEIETGESSSSGVSVPRILRTSASATFADGVRLKKTGAGQLTLDGNLTFGRDAEIVAWEGAVEVRGTVNAMPGSSLNFRGNDNLVFAAPLRLPAGSSFQLLSDGVPQRLHFASTQLTGLGTVLGDVEVRDSGVISPGLDADTGELRIDGDLTIGAEGRLKIELEGAQTGTAYDRLAILGELTLEDAWLELPLLDGFLPAPNDVFTILEAESVSGTFANAAFLNSVADGWRVDWALNSTGSEVLLQAVSVVLQSDFDASGVVDDADLALWRQGYGETGAATHYQGDADGDQDVDGADFLVLQRQLGSNASQLGATTVPEPVSALLLIVGLIAMVANRRLGSDNANISNEMQCARMRRCENRP